MHHDDDRGALHRRRFLAASGAAAAASTIGSLFAMPEVAGATPTTDVVLTPGAGNGVANRVAIQAAVDALGADHVLQLPAGTYEVDVTAAPIWLRRGVIIQGVSRTSTVLDVVPKVPAPAPATPMNSLFDVISASTQAPPRTPPPAGSRFVLRDFAIQGPTTNANTQIAAGFRWEHRGSFGFVRAERLTITGLFSAGVIRSGHGRMEVFDCDINAGEAPVKSFESSWTADAAECVIIGGTHTGFDSKSSSIGLYIHPHVALAVHDVHYRNFNRFAFYANGSDPSTLPPPRFWTVADTDVEDCALAQTAYNAHSKFVRVHHHGTSPGGAESPLAGNVDFIECDLRPATQYGFFPGAHQRNFVDCWIEPATYLVSGGKNVAGTTRFVGCTWKCVGSGRAFNFTNLSTARVIVVDCDLYDCGASSVQLVNVQGGQLDVLDFTVDSPKPNHGVTIATPPYTVVQNGSITYANSGTCPPSP